jgi:8-oxo-dGTP pyrophosphatase MutT (NUDIX family)
VALVRARIAAPVEAGVSARYEAGDLTGADDLAAARAAVVAARGGDEHHEANRARILAFIDAHPDALHRSCLEGHLTGSAAVIDPSTSQVLLLLHAKVRRWLQPGGHADGDGNLARVALREALEETGIVGLQVVSPAIDLDVHVFHNATLNEPDHLHLDVRHLVIAPPGSVAKTNHESDGVRWVPVDDLAAVDLDRGTVRMVASAVAALEELS